jgi:hypothetical protein
MAPGAELRLVGFYQELRRTDGEEQEQEDHCPPGDDEREDGLSGLQRLHGITSFILNTVNRAQTGKQWIREMKINRKLQIITERTVNSMLKKLAIC